MDQWSLGWIFVAGSWLTFGSFGVPIKTEAVMKARIDPLMFQSMKVVWVFLTCWIVLAWEDFDFTPWGILSGAFWVPAGLSSSFFFLCLSSFFFF
jgi:hypothetical protein